MPAWLAVKDRLAGVSDMGTGERLTEVRNERRVFLAPEERLIPYLSRLHGYEIEVEAVKVVS